MNQPTFIKLGSFASVKGGKRLPKGEELHDEETLHPYIRVTDMSTNGLVTHDIKYLSASTHEKIKRYIISSEDVYISIAGTIGRVGMVPRKYDGANLTENAAKICNINPDFIPRYLMYFLNSYYGQAQISAKTGGTSQPKLALYRIEEIEVPSLPRKIQDEIVSIALNYDDLIENNRRRIQLLEESARLLYKEWFVHLRFPGHEHVKITDGVPEGWTKPTIDQVAETVGGGTPSTKINEYWDGGENIWFSPTDLTKSDCIALLDSAKKITDLGVKKSSAKQLPPKTILMTSRASIGYFGIYEGVASTNQGFISLIPQKEILRWYLLHNLKNRVDEIKGLAGGTTFKEINKTTFRAIELLIPSDSLLEQFSDFYTDVYQQILTVKKQTQKLKNARDILLPRLMNGELVV